MIIAKPEKFLLVKVPTYLMARYSCGGKEPCECVDMPVILDHRLPMQVIPYYPDYLESKNAYEKLKAGGYIIHECTDAKTANTIMADAIQKFYEENPELIETIPDDLVINVSEKNNTNDPE
jgi:hypothetical protein